MWVWALLTCACIDGSLRTVHLNTQSHTPLKLHLNTQSQVAADTQHSNLLLQLNTPTLHLNTQSQVAADRESASGDGGHAQRMQLHGQLVKVRVPWLVCRAAQNRICTHRK